MTYDKNGNLLTETLPNGEKTTNTYDKRNLPTKQIISGRNGSKDLQIVTTWDKAGNRLTEKRSLTGSIAKGQTPDDPALQAVFGTFSYQYDGKNRVSEAVEPGQGTIQYRYDSLDNLVKETNSTSKETITYQYNNLNQLLSSTSNQKGNISYQYDPRGNLIQESGSTSSKSYQYDATNHLVSGTSGNTNSRYTYNGLGYRVATASGVTGQETATSYLPDYTSVSRRDLMSSSAQYTQKKIYAQNRVEQITTPAAGNTNPLERKLFVHQNILGSSIQYSTGEGRSFAAIDYDLWGKPLNSSSLTQQAKAVGIAPDFTGYKYDQVLEKYFAQYRFYDAASKRFTALDPIRDGLNWYAYVGNNPTTWVDPLGLLTLMFNGINNGDLGGKPTGYMTDFAQALLQQGYTDTIYHMPVFSNTDKPQGIGQTMAGEWLRLSPQEIFEYKVSSTYDPDLGDVVRAEAVGTGKYYHNMKEANYDKSLITLVNHLRDYEFAAGETLNIIGYSGGASVAMNVIHELRARLEASGVFEGVTDDGERKIDSIIKRIDKAVFIGAPGWNPDLTPFKSGTLSISGYGDFVEPFAPWMTFSAYTDYKAVVNASHFGYFEKETSPASPDQPQITNVAAIATYFLNTAPSNIDPQRFPRFDLEVAMNPKLGLLEDASDDDLSRAYRMQKVAQERKMQQDDYIETVIAPTISNFLASISNDSAPVAGSISGSEQAANNE